MRASTPQGWSGVALEDGRLYVGTQDRDIRALDTETGRTVWKFDLRGEVEADQAIYGTPAISNGIAYVGSYDGTLYALDLTDGNDVWGERRVGGGALSSVEPPWVEDWFSSGRVTGRSMPSMRRTARSNGGSRPATAYGPLPPWRTTGSFSGRWTQRVYALDLDGQLIWEFSHGRGSDGRTSG